LASGSGGFMHIVRTSGTHWTGGWRLGGPWSQSGHGGEEKKVPAPCWVSNPSR